MKGPVRPHLPVLTRLAWTCWDLSRRFCRGAADDRMSSHQVPGIFLHRFPSGAAARAPVAALPICVYDPEPARPPSLHSFADAVKSLREAAGKCVGCQTLMEPAEGRRRSHHDPSQSIQRPGLLGHQHAVAAFCSSSPKVPVPMPVPASVPESRRTPRWHGASDLAQALGFFAGGEARPGGGVPVGVPPGRLRFSAGLRI
jgi:hypothetical protein